jgi:anti-sigma B factor antagonist
MNLILNIRENSGVTIIDAVGRLTLGEATGYVRSAVREVVERGSRRIIFNMAGLSYIDSSGIGALVGAYSTVAAAGGELKLLNLEARLHELIHVTKLYTVFETFDNEASAINSFTDAKLAVEVAA